MANKGIWLIGGAVAIFLILKSKAAGAGSNITITPSDTSNGMNISQQQLQATANLESFSPTAYKDGAPNGYQMYSIGYGHQIQPGEQYLMKGTITKNQGLTLLQNDMQNIVDAINNTGVSFSQGQFDATADLGMSGIQASLDLIDNFNAGGPDAVSAWLPTAYIHWHPIPGGPAQVSNDLVARRQQELLTWNS